jgi:hypothetical protein
MTRAKRKGRDQCTAHRRDGQRCQAQAIEGGWVCRVHGGASPQAIRAARRRELALAVIGAEAAWQAARGTNRERPKFYLLCDAVSALERYDADLDLLRELRAAVRQPGLGPGVRRALLVRARARPGQ